jgi:hypothetical protein
MSITTTVVAKTDGAEMVHDGDGGATKTKMHAHTRGNVSKYILNRL